MTVNSKMNAVARARCAAARWRRRCWPGRLRRRRAGRDLRAEPGDRVRRREQRHRRFDSDANGRKYTVNAHRLGDRSDARLQRKLPIWIQVVADAVRAGLPAVQPGTTPVADADQPDPRRRRREGRRPAAQIDAQQAESAFAPSDLVDGAGRRRTTSLAQYAQYPGVSEAQLIANVEARGRGARPRRSTASPTPARKVLISTIPDLGLTPFADRRARPRTPTPIAPRC